MILFQRSAISAARFLRSLSLGLVLLFARGTASNAQQADADESLCYAFLLNGDVWTSCHGEKRQITRFDDVEDFAIASRELALIRHQRAVQGKILEPHSSKPTYFDSHEAIQVLHLDQQDSSPLKPLSTKMRLVASCGTILTITYDYSIPKGDPFGVIQDAVNLDRLRFEPYRNFRCSSDRRTLVGWVDTEHISLKSGLPPDRDIVSQRAFGEFEYDVSPNGRFIAFSDQGSNILCVVEGNAAPRCTNAANSANRRIAVSDHGEVLYGPSSGDGCAYRDEMHASAKPRPGYLESDECRVLYYWRPDDPTPRRLDLLEYNPQWMAPELAASLLTWATKHFGTERFR